MKIDLSSSLFLGLPFLIGSITIIQSAINRKLADSVGLGKAVFVSNFITASLAFFLLILISRLPQLFPSFYLTKKSELSGMTYLWFLLPGLFGLLIVAGIPFSFFKIGAVETTIMLVSAQAITSVFWDFYFENIPLNSTRLISLFLAIASAVIMCLSRTTR